MVKPVTKFFETATSSASRDASGSPRIKGAVGFGSNGAVTHRVIHVRKGKAMALNLEQKKVVVAELANVAAKAHSLVAAEYAGLTVGQLTELRKKARSSKVFVKVAKNTLVSRAVEGTDYACVKDALVGPMLYAFSEEDPGAAGRLIKEFSKANDKLVAKVVAIGGQMYPGTHVERLASLPTREQALSMLMGVMLAPITKLVRTLAEPAAKTARAVAAVRDQKAA
jgi:large subunit ribosomal protein L10